MSEQPLPDPVVRAEAPTPVRPPDRLTTGADGAAAGFVREARADDLDSVGRVHAASMRASLEAGHDGPLPDGVRAMIAAPVLATGWESAILTPPSPAHHVLVATQGEEVVGLAAIAPAPPVTPSGQAAPTMESAGRSDADVGGTGTADADPEDAPACAEAPTDTASLRHAVELVALGVTPEHQRHGHGSRLLTACVDLARADGADLLLAWVVRGDDSLVQLFSSSGLVPTGQRRELSVGGGVTEVCWAAGL